MNFIAYLFFGNTFGGVSGLEEYPEQLLSGIFFFVSLFVLFVLFVFDFIPSWWVSTLKPSVQRSYNLPTDAPTFYTDRTNFTGAESKMPEHVRGPFMQRTHSQTRWTNIDSAPDKMLRLPLCLTVCGVVRTTIWQLAARLEKIKTIWFWFDLSETDSMFGAHVWTFVVKSHKLEYIFWWLVFKLVLQSFVCECLCRSLWDMMDVWVNKGWSPCWSNCLTVCSLYIASTLNRWTHVVASSLPSKYPKTASSQG